VSLVGCMPWGLAKMQNCVWGPADGRAPGAFSDLRAVDAKTDITSLQGSQLLDDVFHVAGGAEEGTLTELQLIDFDCTSFAELLEAASSDALRLEKFLTSPSKDDEDEPMLVQRCQFRDPHGAPEGGGYWV
jgi:hypothetical protein